MTPTSDAPTVQLPVVRGRSASSTGAGARSGAAVARSRREASRVARQEVAMDVLEATRAGLVDLDDYAPRRLTGTPPPRPF